MINPVRLGFHYRDFWNAYDSWAAAQIDEILNAGCYQPRYYHAPRNADENIAGPGYLKYNLSIPPGSWILGYWHFNRSSSASPPFFMAMITDLGLNHKWFTTPMPEYFFDNHGQLGTVTVTGTYPRGPSLLAAPYPVVAPGQFLVEFWQPNAATNRCQLTFAVAEPVPPDVDDKKVAA